MSKRFKGILAAVALGASAAMTMTACSGPAQTHAGGSAEVPSSIELVVPFSAGGGTDTWARFVAPYLEEKIEGNPKIVVENQPGGESITGANKYVTSGSTDGSKMLVTSGSTYLPALLNRAEVKYDFTKLIPIVVNGTGGAVYVSSSTGITKASDLADFDKTLTYGGISATGNDLVTLLAMDVLDIDIDATFGFEGRGPARLALERGEVNLDYQTTSAFLTQVQPMIDEGKATPLFSFGVPEDGKIVRDPAMPDLPTLEEVYENLHGEAPSGEAYDAYRAFLSAAYFYQKGIWVNEGTDDAIVTAMRDAAKELSTDEEFVEKSKDALGGYPLISGTDAQEDLTAAFDVSDAVRNYTLDLLKNSYDVTVDTK
ncbi:tripartite tricarboxylate transporter substrate-binding protein [Paramicrobacterium agarici]|uniref:Tripartite-type tricarboxylate transporter receptor subunit TctC n=1 Tax=Paramicrobacterium agarici TaxID=630514 RepID=A0A2A9DTW8_9MICO|nr:tripartite tricarboxylate transporter substrate-binding protein [Microbacterium agarici]PFG29821.1 tripartite-type tricarboxylate transporter receptor subunit TctC [Microbacterium agarici]